MSCKRLLQRLIPTILMAFSLGCASEPWNLDRYRDERAVDIEDRLTREEPIVKNPFGKADSN
ncbi:MAG: hypothetical protein WD851_18045 [Pirellulales bacterium]